MIYMWGAGESQRTAVNDNMWIIVCPSSRGDPTLSQSRWVARCCVWWAGGTSWSNAGPCHSNGNTSAPWCLIWASPCAPPASRYIVCKSPECLCRLLSFPRCCLSWCFLFVCIFSQMFHSEDYELLVLQHNCCPYCRRPIDENWIIL